MTTDTQPLPLKTKSVQWAVQFVERHSDGDIFPPIPEISAIAGDPQQLVDQLTTQGVGEYDPLPHRRFIVPKGDLSYRQATQLHPQDSILLTAILHEHGQGIEDLRQPDDRVFSYRFKPTNKHGLYAREISWNDFWNEALDRSWNHKWILHCDIADFYNQIYHHTIENQLPECGFPNTAVKWIKNLLQSTTRKVSRGIPVGPHGMHLIAEATMIPIDNSLITKDINYIRYVDDFIIFCNSQSEARRIIYEIATTLDRQQRLILQQHKTRIFSAEDFQEFAAKMVEDRPVNDEEAELLSIIRKYDHGNPYATLTYNQIASEDWKRFESEVVVEIVADYLNQEPIDYVRLRWFFRRLAQVGHPGALQVIIDHFEQLEPCLSSVCSYITSIQSIPPAEWESIGGRLLGIMDEHLIMDTEFARLSILSLFSKNEHIDHFKALARRFENSGGHTRRQILFAAMANANIDWLREQKETIESMDPWQKMAYVYCISILPRGERRFIFDPKDASNPFEEQLIKWSRSQNN